MKDRIERWRAAFSGDEQSVVRALVSFAWNHAAFQSVVKAVELLPESPDGGKPFNWMLLELLKNTYWGSTVLAIRRLVDAESLIGKRGVMSLRSILNDVRASRAVLTRRVYVEDIAGLAYDAEEVARKGDAFFLRHAERKAVWIPRALQPEPIRQRHDQFDFLSGVPSERRSPDDTIQDWVFDKLEARLAQVQKISDHANIYFAHAATAESREGRGLTQWGSEDATAAFELLVQTAELMGRWFLYEGVGDVLPAPNGDQFVHMDSPLLPGRDTRPLNERWQAFAERTRAWPFIEDTAL
ncbi:MAG: hypothetical protein J0H86_23825 [Xanthomonadaceae bacterium]|nr:hypothetical protein [Xanthomonadaceae bacterium]